MNIFPLIQCDFYKQGHQKMYPENMTYLYSNFTPRKSRIAGVNEVVVFGIQYFIKEYLIKQWNEQFFSRSKSEVIHKFKRYMDFTLGKDTVDTGHIEELHDLGYLPLTIKALPEGTLCPIGIPCLTIANTSAKFGWLVNFLETIISATIWQPMTSATISRQYRLLLNRYALETTGTTNFVPWQGHDFSMRGMSSLESACLSGAGHLIYFTGTDTIPAIQFLEEYYHANVEDELIGASVPATEHSVMCAGTKENEILTFKNLLDKFPNGILSIVSDTWNLWDVCTEYLPQLKNQILNRNGKLVIRPDSGDPVKIITGWKNSELIYEGGKMYINEAIHWGEKKKGREVSETEVKGLIQLLYEIFGGIKNTKGYIELDSHIGAIYGDSITLERAKDICERLKGNGFASTNIIFGIGSYTYQYNTRDTFGFACKATYCELKEHDVIIQREIYKDPFTDDGTKKSAKGLLSVFANPLGKLELHQQVDWDLENKGELKTVFKDGKLIKEYSLQEIRKRGI